MWWLGDVIEVIGKTNENKDKEHFLKVVRSTTLSPTSTVLSIANKKKGYTLRFQFSSVSVSKNLIPGHWGAMPYL